MLLTIQLILSSAAAAQPTAPFVFTATGTVETSTPIAAVPSSPRREPVAPAGAPRRRPGLREDLRDAVAGAAAAAPAGGLDRLMDGGRLRGDAGFDLRASVGYRFRRDDFALGTNLDFKPSADTLRIEDDIPLPESIFVPRQMDFGGRMELAFGLAGDALRRPLRVEASNRHRVNNLQNDRAQAEAAGALLRSLRGEADVEGALRYQARATRRMPNDPLRESNHVRSFLEHVGDLITREPRHSALGRERTLMTAVERGDEGARDAMISFYASHPELAAWRRAEGEARRRRWTAIEADTLPEGTEFRPFELGLSTAGGVHRVIAGAHDGARGLWLHGYGVERFEALDGSFTLNRMVDGDRVPVEVRISSAGAVVITSRSRFSDWTRKTGRIIGRDVVLDTTELRDGTRLRRLDDWTTAVENAAGRVSSYEVNVSTLFGAAGAADRENPAWDAAKSITRALGFDDADFRRSQPIAQWLRDGFTRSDDYTGMRVTVSRAGEITVVYSRRYGRKRVERARFDTGTSVNGDDAGTVLIVGDPIDVNEDGTPSGTALRWREYRADGTRVWWRRDGRTVNGDGVNIISSVEHHDILSATLQRRRADGSWRSGASETKSSSVHEYGGTSLISNLGSTIMDVPVLGHALNGLGWVGNRGYNFIVGGNQYLIGAISGNAESRAHGIAGMERAFGADEARWNQVAGILDAAERVSVDGRVRELRRRELTRQHVADGTTYDRHAYTEALHRDVARDERAAALAGEIGATTYGAQLADWADETDNGWYTAAGIAMSGGEGIAQSLPTIGALSGLGWLSRIKLAENAGRLSTLSVGAAHAGHTVFAPYVMSTWVAHMPEGAARLYSGIKHGDTRNVVAGGGQVLSDILLTAVGVREIRAARRARAERAAEARGSQAQPSDALVFDRAGAEAVRPAMWRRWLAGFGRRAANVGSFWRRWRNRDARETRRGARARRWESIHEADRMIAEQFEATNARRAGSQSTLGRVYGETKATAAESGRAYHRSLAGMEPVRAIDIIAAEAEGTLAPSRTPTTAQQTGPTCTLHAFANGMRAQGRSVTVSEILKVIADHPKLGPKVAAMVRRSGLSAVETLDVYRALAEHYGTGLRVVEPGKLFGEIARTGRGAMVGIAATRSRHQIYVEGLVRGADGKRYVSFIDSNVGGRSFMPLETFARNLRTGGLMGTLGGNGRPFAGRNWAPRTESRAPTSARTQSGRRDKSRPRRTREKNRQRRLSRYGTERDPNRAQPGEHGHEINWNSFENNRLRREHFEKHGAEFNAANEGQYAQMARNFAAEHNPRFQEVVIGRTLIKYDPVTRTMLIGKINNRLIRTFYRAFEHNVDPIGAAIRQTRAQMRRAGLLAE